MANLGLPERDDDALFEIQRDYFLGNYQSCISKANSTTQNTDTLFYMCLSYCHLKKFDNLQFEIGRSKEPCIDLIGMLANYIREPNGRDAIIEELDSILENSPIKPTDDLYRLIVSAIYVRHRHYDKALTALDGLEKLRHLKAWRYLPIQFATIEIYLLINRVDLAERALEKMQSEDDFSTITQLAVILVRLASNKPKDAHDIAYELEEKYRATPLLKNLQTAAAISMGDYTTAKKHCEIALDLDNDNLEALINFTHIQANMRSSPEIRERNLKRLQTLYPDHEFVREMIRLEEELKPFIQSSAE